MEAPSNTDSNNTPTRIHLIEDDPDIRLMYDTLLTHAGYQVTKAKDGEEAWTQLEEAANTDKLPHLVLLDVVLPKKDGFDILKDLRHHPKLHSLKVILLTNLAQDIDRKQGEKLQADDYIVKAHITPKELLKKIEGYLSQ